MATRIKPDEWDKIDTLLSAIGNLPDSIWISVDGEKLKIFRKGEHNQKVLKENGELDLDFCIGSVIIN